MQCQICFEKFDHSLHKPFVLIPCTHTVCITCLGILPDKRCPTCGREFMDKNPNWALLELVGDSDYDLLKKQMNRSFNETEILKKKLYDVHQRKLEENNQKLKSIQNEIAKQANKLVDQLRENEKRLLDEIKNLEHQMSINLNEIIAKLEKNFNEKQFELNRMRLEKDELTELQIKKLGHDLFNHNLDLTFKIDQIKKLNECELVEFIALDNTVNLIGTLNNKGKTNEDDFINQERLMQRGINLLEMKRANESLYLFESILQLNPQNAFAYKYKGNALFDMGQYLVAIECYDKAIQFDPNFKPSLEFKKGLVYKEMKEYAKSIESFDLSLSLNPNHELVYFNKGNVYFESTDYQKAIGCFEKAIEFGSQPNPMYYSSMGLCLYYLKEYDKSIEALKKSIQLDQFNAVSYGSLGLVYYELAEYYKAIDCFDKAIQLDMKNTNNYSWKAAVHVKLKEYERALLCYEKVIELEPNNLLAKENRETLISHII